jgi:hypothetical protein
MSSLVIGGGAGFGLVLGWLASLLWDVRASRRRDGLLLLWVLAAGGEVYLIMGPVGFLAFLAGSAVGWALHRACIYFVRQRHSR